MSRNIITVKAANILPYSLSSELEKMVLSRFKALYSKTKLIPPISMKPIVTNCMFCENAAMLSPVVENPPVDIVENA